MTFRNDLQDQLFPIIPEKKKNISCSNYVVIVT